MVGYDVGGKSRNHITLKITSEESKSVIPEMADGWKETSPPTPSLNYEHRDI